MGMSHSDRTDQIIDLLLKEFQNHGIEDTTENRILFLEGIKDAWAEDTEEDPMASIEKSIWQMALATEIARLKIANLSPTTS